MRIKNKMLILTLILVSLFMISAVSAASDTEDIVNSDVSNDDGKVTATTTNDVSDSSVEKTSKSTDIGTDSLKKTGTIKEEKTSTNKNDTQKKTEKDTLESESSNILSKTSTNTLKSTVETSNDLLKDSAIIEVDSWSKLKNNITNNNEISIKLINNLTTNGEYIYIDNGKVVTINGNGHTIDAQGQGTTGIFIVNDATLILENLKIINGKSEYEGGAITAYKAKLTLINTTLQNNNANKYGGAIYANNAKVTLINTTLQNNTANDYGGAIYTENSNITITTSALQNNNANKYGGAIDARYYSQVNITNSTLQNNTATYYGGAIYAEAGSVLNVDYCLFQENTASSGRTIYAKDSTTVDGADNAFTDKNCIEGDGSASISLEGVTCRSDSFTSLYYQIMNSPTPIINLTRDYQYYSTSDDGYGNDSNYIKGIPITTSTY